MAPLSIRGYELTKRLVRKPNAETWLARDASGRDVIVKAYSGDGRALVRFASRAAAASALRHPCIAAPSDRGTSGPWMFVVREHFQTTLAADGGDSASKLATVIALGRALEHAHGRGLVHGAVKPSNVFVGEAGRPILADFSMLLGAPNEFTAPELRTDPTGLHPRVDQYSLAALFAWLILGRLPKPGEVVSEDSRLDQAVRRALAPDGSSRYMRLDQLLDAFESALPRPSTGLVADTVRPPVVERSGEAVHVRVVSRWTPETVATCVEQIGRALAQPGVRTIGYYLDTCTGSQSAAIEALSDMHRAQRGVLKRVGFCTNMPQARGMAILVGSRVAGLPWKTFGSPEVMEAWLRGAGA